MSEAADQAAVRGLITTALAALPNPQPPVEDPNRAPLDLATLTGPYVCWELQYLDSQQKNLGEAQVKVHDYGQIYLAVGIKDGQGELVLSTLRDHFVQYLERKVVGSFNTRVAKRQPGKEHLGFYYLPLIVDFWSERTSSS